MLSQYSANCIAGILVQLKTTVVVTIMAQLFTSIVASPIHFLFQQ
jgi:hypothetical protein